MFGPRKIDSLRTIFVRGHFFRRAGAGRSLAAHYASHRYDIVAVSEMTPGDALAFATRFDLQWAYRGSQAMFWQNVFERAHCTDLYLPLHPRRPFQRRGFVQVRVDYAGQPLTIALTQFSKSRDVRALELGFVRASLRDDAAPRGIFFAACSDEQFALHAPGWHTAAAPLRGTFTLLRGATAQPPVALDIGVTASARSILLEA